MNIPVTPPSLQNTLQRAAAQGLLPTNAVSHAPMDARPWPIVAVTALGAWLAIVPLVAFFGLLFGSFVTRGPGGTIIGTLLMGLAVVLLRRDRTPLFVEQLAVPLLVTGAALLGMALSRSLSMTEIALLYAALALGLAVAVKPAWMRSMLGAAAALALALALLRGMNDPVIQLQSLGRLWWSATALLGIWLASQAWAHLAAPAPQLARTVDAIADGWVVMALLVLTSAAGRTFLLSGALGGGLNELGMDMPPTGAPPTLWLPPLVSVAAVAAAAIWLSKRWPSLTNGASAAPMAVVVLLALGLATFMPALGLALLVAAVAATQRAWRVATLACAVALWVLGSFYYQLQWSLAYKAGVMAVAGALLGAATVLAQRTLRNGVSLGGQAADRTVPKALAAPRGAALAIVVSVAACLAVANFGIVDKERLIANGQPVFVKLMPVDPRSLMQGDFMRLAPAQMPELTQSSLGNREVPRAARAWGEKPLMVAKIGADRVAVPNRRAQSRSEALAADELLIELTEKDGRFVIASDAWFFKEGEAARWQAGRYAEYRVTRDGRALLVNLRGEKLEAL